MKLVLQTLTLPLASHLINNISITADDQVYQYIWRYLKQLSVGFSFDISWLMKSADLINTFKVIMIINTFHRGTQTNQRKLRTNTWRTTTDTVTSFIQNWLFHRLVFLSYGQGCLAHVRSAWRRISMCWFRPTLESTKLLRKSQDRWPLTPTSQVRWPLTPTSQDRWPLTPTSQVIWPLTPTSQVRWPLPARTFWPLSQRS